MFNVKHWIEAVLGWLGESLSDAGIESLEEFAVWLREEALPAGGIGPQEGKRLEERHLADSLTFAAGVDPSADSVLDVGTGVGLPGIPLAILRPQSKFVLIDRSGRRADLAARAVRMLDLLNVSVVRESVENWTEVHDGMVMRSTLRPVKIFPHVGRLLRPGCSAIIGLSRSNHSPSIEILRSASSTFGLELDVVDVRVLDSPTSLLRITRGDNVS